MHQHVQKQLPLISLAKPIHFYVSVVSAPRNFLASLCKLTPATIKLTRRIHIMNPPNVSLGCQLLATTARETNDAKPHELRYHYIVNLSRAYKHTHAREVAIIMIILL